MKVVRVGPSAVRRNWSRGIESRHVEVIAVLELAHELPKSATDRMALNWNVDRPALRCEAEADTGSIDDAFGERSPLRHEMPSLSHPLRW